MTPPYPDAPRQDLTEIIHGHQVADPYRWLEDATSNQTKDWLAAQDELYREYAAGLAGREALAARLRELLGTGEVGTPAWRGDACFCTRRDPGQEHSVLYVSAGSAGGPGGRPPGSAPSAGPGGTTGPADRALIDPVAIDPSGATTLDGWYPDWEGRLLAYQLSHGGTEESVLRVLDVATGQDVDGPIDRCRYSSVAWLPGGTASGGTASGGTDSGGAAFYYTRRLAPETVPAGEEQFHRRVWLHRLGTPAESDVLILGDGLEKTNYYGVSVSRDGRWLVITASAGTAPRNDVWVADLTESDPAAPNLQVMQSGVDARTWPHAGRDGRFYLLTDAGAPRGRIAVADPADPAFPEQASWQEYVGEDPEAVLHDLAILDGPGVTEPVLLVSRARHAISEITVHDLAFGNQIGLVELPGLGTVGGLAERPEGGHEAWFGYGDYGNPGVVLRYDGSARTTDVWRRAPGTVELPAVSAEQLTYASADGTPIRMVVLTLAGDEPVPPKAGRPAILYGYGGFDVSLAPAFSASITAWVEAGGVYAIAGLRGGGEEGEQWHRAGMRERKQNVFDDFHAAAEALVAGGWTTSAQLTVWGGSNGGLLVGASITQRPELSAAAVCSAPLLDMVRYERFGLGETWNDEYGSATDPAEFEWLISYSPYHHVRPGVVYPAVLFTIFDGDTRVDTMHARKMCAALQDATAAPFSQRPVLLRREAQVGHGARSVSRTIGLAADSLAFAAAQTGLGLR